jgi:hypothetical protein
MSVHDRHIRTNPPFNGLSPTVLNLPMKWVGQPKLAASAAIVTKTQQTAGSSVAAGTQPDYARNLAVFITPTASSDGVTGGGVTIYGKDQFGSTRSETFAGSSAILGTAGQTGAINFASVDTVSMKLSFLSATSSAASAFGVYVGVGNKLGLPVELRSSNGVIDVRRGTVKLLTSAGASSTDNQYTAVTGDYWKNGVQASGGWSSALQAEIDFYAMGCAVERPTPV